MSYRKITVDDVEYQYVVGKTHVKVRGLGVWPKEEVSDTVSKNCECCGEPLDRIYDSNQLRDIDYQVRVRPQNVAAKIHETVRLNT